jgi:hypothetical protein
MSDAGDVVAVLGTLDRSIAELDPDAAAEARAAAATLIPPLGDPAAAGWYDRFLETSEGEPAAATLEAALRNLAGAPASRAALARRVIAVGAVARALPELYGPGGDLSQFALEALSGPGILRSAPGVGEEVGEEIAEGDGPPVLEEAPAFLELLVDRVEFPDIGAYRQFLETATARNLVHNDLAAVPAPCATTLVEVPSDDQSDPAVALVTEVCVTGVTLAGLAANTSFMNPANWSTYSYWCHMLPPVSGNPPDPAAAVRFLEAVALDCPTDWFEVAVWLDFSPLVRVPTALVRTFKMSPPAVQGDVVDGEAANGAVNIDEGSIIVIDQGAHLRVRSTKRIRFTAPIDPYALAVMACGAGYGALAADFVVEGTGGSAVAVTC